ncbi:hypothetical protein [Rhizobium terrae]|uniref:hypothetical protein n=1 Tax=Rhizobium terrae TaxID=2171756 RepID=UPI000E3CCD4F|nr:hypothetical protein [Rhizobium terrae]
MADFPKNTKDLSAKKALKFILWIILAAFAVVAAQSLQAESIPAAIKQLTIMLSTAGAALMFGALVGFLFGIPRRLQREGVTAVAQDGQRPIYEGNTNLEQISDWLTKLIVGVTLVEFTSIAEELGSFGKYVNNATARGGDDAFAVGIIIFFFIAGFLFGYLWTRLYLGRALSDAEVFEKLEQKAQEATVKAEEATVKAQEAAVEIDSIKQQIQSDTNAIAFSIRQLNRATPPTSTTTEAEALFKGASGDTLRQIFYMAEENRSNNWFRDKPQMERSMVIFESLMNTDTAKRFYRHTASLGYCYKDKLPPDNKRAIELLDEAIRIRGDAAKQGWHSYEANRGLARIALEACDKPDLKSSSENREAIIEDIETGLADDWTRKWLLADLNLRSWAAANDYSLPLE